MRARIHRGANEVGGSCIELESRSARLVLDLGRPLWAKRDDVLPLPEVAGLAHPDLSLRAVVLSHPHLDHYGLAGDSAAPIAMGSAAWRMLAEARFFTGGVLPPAPRWFLRDREPLTIGPFEITPFLNDHSAFDAYSLLVEADGRRLFYTGDFRAHGRKHSLFDRLVRERPRADVVLMEGTNLRAGVDVDARGASEHDVETSVVELAKATRGMILAAFSPQNIDRLVTFFRAARRSGRDLVLDLYAATMAAATGLATIPQASWDGVRVFLPHSQRARVIKEKAFARSEGVRAARIYPEDLRARAGELIMIFRGSMARDLDAAGCLDGAHLAWSMWSGYLRDESGTALQAWAIKRGISMSIHHSSGHAFVPDLRRLVEALAPEGRADPQLCWRQLLRAVLARRTTTGWRMVATLTNDRFRHCENALLGKALALSCGSRGLERARPRERGPAVIRSARGRAGHHLSSGRASADAKRGREEALCGAQGAIA